MSGVVAPPPMKLEAPPPITTEQFFRDALIEPSLQTKVAPWQWEMPPLRPEQGVLAAAPSGNAKEKMMNIIKNCFIMPPHLRRCAGYSASSSSSSLE